MSEPKDEKELPTFAAELVAAPITKREDEIDLNETLRQNKLERLRDVEDDILAKSLEVVRATLKFGELDPATMNSEEAGYAMPDSWMEEFGGDVDKANEALRIAKAAWLPNKDAPIGIILAQKTLVGIVKARATEKAAPRSLSIAYIVNNAESPPPEYEEIEVE